MRVVKMFAVKLNVRLVIVCLEIALLFRTVVCLDYSIPALQKCDFNLLPDKIRDVDVPEHRMTIGEEFKFRIAEKCATRLPHCMKRCSNPMTQLQIPFTETPVTTNVNSSADYYEVDEPIIKFTPKGYLRIENEYFSVDDYCVYAQTSEELVVKICPSTCSGGVASSGPVSEVCVPKCCSLHKVIDLESASCVYTTTGVPWSPLVYKSSKKQICGEKRANLKLHYVQTPPECENFHRFLLRSVHGSTRVRFRLLTNGTVLLRELGQLDWTTLQSGTYCLDGVQFGEGPFTGDPMDQVLILCDHVQVGDNETSADEAVEDSEKRLTASGIAYIVLLFSGIPFLLITEIVYVLVWGQQNVHGWTLAGHTLAVLLHYLAQAVANTVSRIFNSEQNASSICMMTGVLNHYFVLASFLWLTVINYDLFSMFRHLKTTVGRSRGLKRFLVYSCIAWGIPLVVVGVSVVLDVMFGLYGDDGDCEIDVVVPLYGHKSCYMGKDARPYYLYFPVLALMVVNLVLALMTFWNMYWHDREAVGAHGEIRRSTKHRRKFSVMAKLFVVMGLVWVFELFVWSFIKENEVLPWYLVFPDVFNLFQAIAIFVLFACQPKILGQVEGKYPRLKVFTCILKKLSCGNAGSDKQCNRSDGNVKA